MVNYSSVWTSSSASFSLQVRRDLIVLEKTWNRGRRRKAILFKRTSLPALIEAVINAVNEQPDELLTGNVPFGLVDSGIGIFTISWIRSGRGKAPSLLIKDNADYDLVIEQRILRPFSCWLACQEFVLSKLYRTIGNR